MNQLITIDKIEELPADELIKLSAKLIKDNCELRTASANKCNGCPLHNGTECKAWDIPSQWEV